jgi:hypothetical protein
MSDTTPAPQDTNQEVQEDRPLTAKDLATWETRFQAQILDSVNKAISSREKRAKARPQDEEPTPKDEGSRVTRLERELSEFKERASQAEKKEKLTAAESVLRERVAGRVKPEAVGTFMKLMRHEGMLTLDDEGNPVIKMQSGSQVLEFGLEDGIQHVLKNPDFAVFMAAPSSGGSGASALKKSQGTPSYHSKPKHLWTAEERQAEVDRNVALTEERLRGKS